MQVEVRNFLLVGAGWIFVSLGFVGVFIPLLPTVPFLILAAACFSKGSPRLHAWLLSHERLGPPLRDWHEHRVIRKRAKWLATLVIISSFALSIAFLIDPTWIKIMLSGIGISVLLFIWTRKSQIS